MGSVSRKGMPYKKNERFYPALKTMVVQSRIRVTFVSLEPENWLSQLLKLFLLSTQNFYIVTYFLLKTIITLFYE